MDESYSYNVEWKKPDLKEYLLCDSIYIDNNILRCSTLNYSGQRLNYLSVSGCQPANKGLLTFLFCVLGFQINFQVAISADYFSQTPSNSRSLPLFRGGLSRRLPTSTPQEQTFLYGDSAISALARFTFSHPFAYSSCKLLQALLDV